MIVYKTKTASSNDILNHLTECDADFVPPLSKRVSLKEYSKKIFDKAITFEAWENNTLIALIAAYFGSKENDPVFITSVSVFKSNANQGIASQLMQQVLDYAKKNKLNTIRLEVSPANIPAVNFYKKWGFYEHESKEDCVILQRQI